MIEKINNYDQIANYLQQSKIRLKNKRLAVDNIQNYSAKKLEGIQQGIPLFENLSMDQIMQIIKDKMEFVIKRGCSNQCIHCYANALPEIHHKLKNQLTVIAFEDFKNFCSGFEELSKRLNFNILGSKRDYITLFHDGDSSSIYLQDSDGNTYDYLDLAKKVNELTNSVVIFDTSGWNIQDKKTQKRMEELVQKAKNSRDYRFIEFNISINPFSPFYDKSLAYKSAGDKEKEEKLRNIYTDRIANVIFTMSPLFENNRLYFIQRAFENNYKQLEGYQVKDLQKLIDEIIQKVKQMYINDFNSEQKVISSMDQVYKYINTIKKKTKETATGLGITGRLLTNFKNKINVEKHTMEPDNSLASIIDINGKVYFTDFEATKKTDIQLNYKNKNAETPQIYPLCAE